MIKINVSPEALSDLDEIKEYIQRELENPDAAQSTVVRIAAAMRSLAENPDRGMPLAARMSQWTDYRYLVSGNYLVIYRREDDTVFITRVMYNRRDYIRTLFYDLNSKS